MELTTLVAAGAGTGSGFVVGVVLGWIIGVLLAPAIHIWVAHREWTEASREARLADRLFERMGVEVGGAEEPHEVDGKVGSAWRTHP